MLTKRRAPTLRNLPDKMSVTVVLKMRDGSEEVLHGETGPMGVMCCLRSNWIAVEPINGEFARFVWIRDIESIEIWKQEDWNVDEQDDGGAST